MARPIALSTLLATAPLLVPLLVPLLSGCSSAPASRLEARQEALERSVKALSEEVRALRLALESDRSASSIATTAEEPARLGAPGTSAEPGPPAAQQGFEREGLPRRVRLQIPAITTALSDPQRDAFARIEVILDADLPPNRSQQEILDLCMDRFLGVLQKRNYVDFEERDAKERLREDLLASIDGTWWVHDLQFQQLLVQ